MPPVYVMGGELPAPLLHGGTVGSLTEPNRTSCSSAIGQVFGVSGFDVSVLFLDRGLWDLFFSFYARVTTGAGAASDLAALYFTLNNTLIPIPLAQFSVAGTGTQGNVFGQVRLSLGDTGGKLGLLIPPLAAVGFANVGVFANKIL